MGRISYTCNKNNYTAPHASILVQHVERRAIGRHRHVTIRHGCRQMRQHLRTLTQPLVGVRRAIHGPVAIRDPIRNLEPPGPFVPREMRLDPRFVFAPVHVQHLAARIGDEAPGDGVIGDEPPGNGHAGTDAVDADDAGAAGGARGVGNVLLREGAAGADAVRGVSVGDGPDARAGDVDVVGAAGGALDRGFGGEDVGVDAVEEGEEEQRAGEEEVGAHFLV